MYNRLILSNFMGKEEGYKANETGNDKAKVIITTEEYFNIICNILSEKGLLPDVVKCFYAADNPIPMSSINFRIVGDLYYNEGIYLQLWHKRTDDDTEKLIGFGTFYSLRQDREAMQLMGKLLADVLAENQRYVNGHLDDFTWEGTEVYAVDEDGNRWYQYHMVSSMEQALEIKDELLKKCPTVIIRDNITRKKQFTKNMGMMLK